MFVATLDMSNEIELDCGCTVNLHQLLSLVGAQTITRQIPLCPVHNQLLNSPNLQGDFPTLATAYYLSQVDAPDGAPHIIRVNEKLFKLHKSGLSVQVEEL